MLALKSIAEGRPLERRFDGGRCLDTLFEERRKPAAVKVGNGSHIANVTQTSGITTPRHQHRQVLKGRAVVR
jgi:hypothetical protein